MSHRGKKTPPPSPLLIRATQPLTARHPQRPREPWHCGVCGKPAAEYVAWRECDEKDAPIAGGAAVLLLGVGHKACRTAIDEHPRLYKQDVGEPGSFTGLCAACPHRVGQACLMSKAGGGPGITVHIAKARVCRSDYGSFVFRVATACTGRGDALPIRGGG